jgi:hypothetical protein
LLIPVSITFAALFAAAGALWVWDRRQAKRRLEKARSKVKARVRRREKINADWEKTREGS